MNQTHFGSCLCQQIKFEIKGDFESFYLCHCKYCQKDTGSAHGANLFSTSAQLTWLSGEAKVKSFNLVGTRHSKSFCADCGSAMPSQQGPLLVVPAGSLDTEFKKAPDAHLFCASKATWENNLDSIKKFENFPK